MAGTGVWRRSGWPAFLISSAARGLLATLAALAVWAMVPAMFGLKPTVVMSGSMEPRLSTGDVVMSRPVPASELSLGQTLLFDDPDQPGHLRMHRYVGDKDGLLVTKGDANPDNDSTPVDAATVKGVATLRVPYIGSPMAWLTNGQPQNLVVLALVALAVLAAATYFKAAPASDDAAEDETVDGDAAVDAPSDPDTDGAFARPHRDRHLLRAGGIALSIAVITVVAMTSSAAPAYAAFSRKTTTPQNTLNAATYFSCRSAGVGASATAIWAFNNANGSTNAADQSASSPKYPGTYSSTGITYGVPGPCRQEDGSGKINAIALDGSSGRVSNAAQISAPNYVVQQIWFKIGAGQPGGVLSSITDMNVGDAAGETSFALGVTGAAYNNTLVMGVGLRNNDGTINTAVQRVFGNTNVKDGQWHLATAVVRSNGARLYLDGVADSPLNTDLVATNGVGGQTYVGYGDASDLQLNTNQNNYFTGSVAYFSDYFYQVPVTEYAAAYDAAS